MSDPKQRESPERQPRSRQTGGREAGAQEKEAQEAGAREPGKFGERKEQRLQKILAGAGIASRRKAEEFIAEGRVQVNGQRITALGSKADPEHDHIRVDGKLLQRSERRRYFMLNKPKGVVTTMSDPQGRPTVIQFLRPLGARVFPVGRLDYQSEGLLLMTNDGEMANALTSAASKVEKKYFVKVSGKPSQGNLEQLRNGVMIEKGHRGDRKGRIMTQPAEISLVRDGDNPWYEVTLIEGKNREIRKMFEEVGHFVEKIRRVGYGPLVLDLKPGEARELTEREIWQLQRAALHGTPRPGRKPAAKQHAAKRVRPAKSASRKPAAYS